MGKTQKYSIYWKLCSRKLVSNQDQKRRRTDIKPEIKVQKWILTSGIIKCFPYSGKFFQLHYSAYRNIRHILNVILIFTENLLKLKFFKMYILAHITGKSRRYTSFRHGWIQGHKLSLGLKSPCVGSASSALAQCGGRPVGCSFSSSKIKQPQ